MSEPISQYLSDLVRSAADGELQSVVAELGLELRMRLGAATPAHRRFVLQRHEDVSGQSGTGFVAEGCLFSTGVAVIQWNGPHASTVVWPSIEHALAIHGHGGRTEIVWLDE